MSLERSRTTLRRVVVLVIAFTIFATGAAAQTVGYPLTVTDDTGAELTLEAKPRRIVSLTMFSDEVLVDLVDHSRLIAVTNLSEDPAISNIVDGITDIPNRITFNVEVVVGLRPDLVIVANWSEADKVTQLRRAGVPVFLAATGLTVPDIRRKILTVATLVGESAAGRAMVAEMDRRLAAVREKVRTVPESRRRQVVDYAVWGTAQGAGSSWDEIIRHAGAVNAVGTLTADEWGQVPLSKEKLVELDPDILILPGWVYGDPEGAAAFYKQTINDPALGTLKAVKNEQVYQMPEGLKATTSQYIAEAVEYLAQLTYPELFD
jgi:iron complex transport system substrate-binding protein